MPIPSTSSPTLRVAATPRPWRQLIKDTNVDATLVLNCPSAIASSTQAAQAVIDLKSTLRRYTLLTSWVGSHTVEKARHLFSEHRIPTYDTPEQAIRAFMHIHKFHRNQLTLTETPPSIPEVFTPDTGKARTQIQQALDEGRCWLSEPEAKAVLTAYGIPTVLIHVASTPREIAEQAEQLGVPVALKIVSPDITHKSDVGGVVLDLNGANAVEAAALGMLARIKIVRPEACVQGFSIQAMVKRPRSL